MRCRPPAERQVPELKYAERKAPAIKRGSRTCGQVHRAAAVGWGAPELVLRARLRRIDQSNRGVQGVDLGVVVQQLEVRVGEVGRAGLPVVHVC